MTQQRMIFSLALLCVIAINASLTGSSRSSDHRQDLSIAQQDQAIDQQDLAIDQAGPEQRSDQRSSDQRLASEHFLPSATRAWVSISSITDLEIALNETRLGKLAHDPDLAPVIDSFAKQITDWLDNRNMKFALNMENLTTINSGELCFAAILNQNEANQTSNTHAILVLADVLGHEADYQRLMADVETDLTVRGAKSSELSLHGQTVTRWEFEKPRGIAVRENVFFARVDNRLIACDDQAILADVIAAILEPEAYEGALAKHDPFVRIRQRCSQDLESWNPQIRWFMEPFGYIELTDAIYKRKRTGRLDPNVREPREIAAILRRQGFGATQGFGGDLAFATEGMEMLHRGFIYTPAGPDGQRFEKAARLLDFPNPGSSIEWESWIPELAATAVTLHWDFATGLESVGLLVDEFTRPGNWETIVDGWKKGRQGIKFDIFGIASRLSGKITLISDFEEPIDVGSERLVVGLKITPEGDNEQWIADELDAFFKPQKTVWKPLPYANRRTIWKAEEPDDDDDLLKELDDLDDLGFDPVPTGEKGEKEPPLFPEKFVLVINQTIYISNDLNYLKKIAEGTDRPLADNSDLLAIADQLDLFSSRPDSIRQFARVDRSVKFVYELLRKNKVPRDNSLLARVLRDLQEGEVTRKIDGSKLPQDFENVVAPHLGLSGWSLETEEDGWFFIGIILPKPENDRLADPVLSEDDR